MERLLYFVACVCPVSRATMGISVPLEVGARPEDSQLAFRAQLPRPMGSGEGQSLAVSREVQRSGRVGAPLAGCRV